MMYQDVNPHTIVQVFLLN